MMVQWLLLLCVVGAEPAPVVQGLAKGEIQARAESGSPTTQPRRRQPRSRPASQPTKAPEAKAPADDDEDDKKEDRYLLVRGGNVHFADHSSRQVDILCKNGTIHRIGEISTLPDDTEILEAAGHQIYPGLVGVNTRRLVVSADRTDFFSLQMVLGLAAGMTTVVNGSQAFKLTYGTTEGHELAGSLFESFRYNSGRPDERRKLRLAFERVREFLRSLERYEREKRDDPDAKKPDERWIRGDYAQARRLMEGDATALASVRSVGDLRAVADFARQFGFKLVVRGAHEGYLIAGELARAGVTAIVTPRDRWDRDRSYMAANGSSIENAAILHGHGVPVVITPRSTGISTGGLAGRDLQHLAMEAAFAVRGGLSEDAARDAITLEAARALGLDHRIGSIEEGKDADFAITDGDLLHYMTHVRWTVVNGRIAYDKQKDSLFDHIRPDGDVDSPPPADHWPRSLGEDW